MEAVTGLIYRPSALSSDEAADLLRHIDAQPWRTDLKRRVQHYGYRYDYKARAVGPDDWLGPLPGWLHDPCARVAGADGLGAAPEQVIVNEYQPGQGIAAHVDCLPCFGPRIAILSLGSAAEMVFTHGPTGETRALILEPRSLTTLSGPARHDWRHAIPARKSDGVAGARVRRERRVSVTFRTIVRAPADA